MKQKISSMIEIIHSEVLNSKDLNFGHFIIEEWLDFRMTFLECTIEQIQYSFQKEQVWKNKILPKARESSMEKYRIIDGVQSKDYLGYETQYLIYYVKGFAWEIIILTSHNKINCRIIQYRTLLRSIWRNTIQFHFINIIDNSHLYQVMSHWL